MANFETLKVASDGPIGRLTLARPDKLNPLSSTTLSELALAARWFDDRDEVKVVVVSGAGRAFSAGSDLSSFAGPQDLSPRDAADLGRLMAEAVAGMNAVTIASIRGWCVGGGLVLATACDMRLAADGAKFSIPEVDLGIPLTWGGIPRLIGAIGPAMTKELVMTCRKFDAPEAFRIGFLNRSLPESELDAAVDALAAELALKASHALRSTKRHVNAIVDTATGVDRSWADADGLVTALTDEECAQARRDYLERRAKKS